MFEKLILNAMCNFFYENNLILSKQSGFNFFITKSWFLYDSYLRHERVNPGDSCINQLISITH